MSVICVIVKSLFAVRGTHIDWMDAPLSRCFSSFKSLPDTDALNDLARLTHPGRLNTKMQCKVLGDLST